MEKKTIGIVTSVKKQWWQKVNKKAARLTATDGATFPHIIKIQYDVDGKEYTKTKWLSAGSSAPSIGTKVTVVYDECNPKKCSIFSIVA